MSEKPMKPSDKALFPDQLLGDIRQMIEEARASVAATVNAGLTMLIGESAGGSARRYSRESGRSMARRLSQLWRDN